MVFFMKNIAGEVYAVRRQLVISLIVQASKHPVLTATYTKQ
jgi:hypothetical protein